MASAPQEVWGDLATTAFVGASHLFRSLDEAAQRDLLQVARLVRFQAGETISGPSDDGFYLLLDGSAAVGIERKGASLELTTLERGAFHGVARALGEDRSASLVARTDVVVVAFPAAMIGALAERFPRMKKLLQAVLAARDREASEKGRG
jgi:CRP-like cAMP-binding protein